LGIPVSVCGEVAGDRRYTRLLLALGLRDFSMHPAELLEVKQVLRETNAKIVQEALKLWLSNPIEIGSQSLLQVLDESQISR